MYILFVKGSCSVFEDVTINDGVRLSNICTERFFIDLFRLLGHIGNSVHSGPDFCSFLLDRPSNKSYTEPSLKKTAKDFTHINRDLYGVYM